MWESPLPPPNATPLILNHTLPPTQSHPLPSPTKITIISHSFKKPRFLNLHIPALNFPLSNVSYIGIDPPFSATRMADIQEGDRLRGYGAWEKDLYGEGEVLRRKREGRGWNEGRFWREMEQKGGGELLGEGGEGNWGRRGGWRGRRGKRVRSIGLLRALAA